MGCGSNTELLANGFSRTEKDQRQLNLILLIDIYSNKTVAI